MRKNDPLAKIQDDESNKKLHKHITDHHWNLKHILEAPSSDSQTISKLSRVRTDFSRLGAGKPAFPGPGGFPREENRMGLMGFRVFVTKIDGHAHSDVRPLTNWRLVSGGLSESAYLHNTTLL